MSSLVPVPTLEPELVFPPDESLPGFAQLFDASWVWERFCAQAGEPEEAPEKMRVAQLSHRPGRRAVVTYVFRWSKDTARLDDRLVVDLTLDQPITSFLYPNDPQLPGLPEAVSPLGATDLTSTPIATWLATYSGIQESGSGRPLDSHHRPMHPSPEHPSARWFARQANYPARWRCC